jgi:2-C-methyl-D-erythritol 2,4-cyclodiphosphate synthase
VKPSFVHNSTCGCRTGFGFDAHDYSLGGTLALGGVNFPGHPQLRGHSDGDALLHAVIDALLGASGLGDIGELFPDTKKSIKGISSRVMLKNVVKKIRSKGFAIKHIDTVVVAAKPKLTPMKKKMRMRIASDVGVSVEAVNIKAKTPEGTRLLSEAGGIAAWAVATLNHV